jgi:hypothetical protein
MLPPFSAKKLLILCPAWAGRVFPIADCGGPSFRWREIAQLIPLLALSQHGAKPRFHFETIG